MAGSRQDELYDALQLKGYPEDFLPGNCIQADEYRLHCNPDAGVSLQDIRTETGGCCR